MNVDLHGPMLADYLNDYLNDLEFELLLRKRIERLFKDAFTKQPAFGEHHSECTFTFSWGDAASWRVALGSNYNNTASLRGEVLTKTVINAATQWELQHGNKLSLLLPAPTCNEEEINNG